MLRYKKLHKMYFDSNNALAGHVASLPNQGTDDAIDSDGIDNASSVCVGPGDENLTIDFGYYRPVVNETICVICTFCECSKYSISLKINK